MKTIYDIEINLWVKTPTERTTRLQLILANSVDMVIAVNQRQILRADCLFRLHHAAATWACVKQNKNKTKQNKL